MTPVMVVVMLRPSSHLSTADEDQARDSSPVRQRTEILPLHQIDYLLAAYGCQYAQPTTRMETT